MEPINSMQKLFLLAASIFGILGTIIDAFGTHKFAPYLREVGRLDTFETAIKYQFYHTFVLLVIGVLLFNSQPKMLIYAGYSFILGIIIFSGSLYILCATGITRLGIITPIGGLAFITGWILLAVGFYKSL